MAAPKAKTIQQRFGFMDNDLKTANHDDIMIWLDNAVSSMLHMWLGCSQDWILDDFQFAYEDQYPRWGSIEKPFPDKQNTFESLHTPEKPKIDITSKVWEQPIYTGGEGYRQNKYIVGFADMLVIYKHPKLYYNIDSEEFNIYKDDRYVFFEVKSSIPSLGELIRQIRMYQQYVSGKWLIVSPDDKFADQLNAQGIGFIKYHAT